MALTSQTVLVDGRTTEYLTGGAGEPLVFLHGGGIVEGFDPLDALTDRFRVIAPFMPGFSSTEIDPPTDSREKLVAQVIGVLDALDIDKTVLVGHSIGGWLATSTALAHPERFSHLVLVCPFGLDVDGHGLAPVFMMTPEEERLALTNDPSVWEGRVPSGPDPDFEAARELEGQALGRFMTGPSDPELQSKLGSVTHQTLILWGDDDKIVPFGHAPEWDSAIPNSELKTYPGAGHLLLHERPEAVEAIADFAGS